MKITDLKLNDENPRSITDKKMDKLCASIRAFPKMMAIRPIVVNADNVVIGGNMRLRACVLNGMTEIPDKWVRRVADLTPDEQRRFVIEDNVAFGDWDWDVLANHFDEFQLMEFGLDIPQMNPIDPTHTVEFSDAANFIIKCDNIDQLELLKTKLDVTGSRMGYEQFIQKFNL
jgi:hypothetical protein